MIRLFIAMRIPYEIRREIFSMIGEIIPEYRRYKWEKEEKIHLTLKFIGSMDEKYLNDLENKLSFIENYNKFHFNFTGFNFFYSHKIPQILWLGLKTNDPVKKFVNEIEDVTEGFSTVRENREFKSHLTLMRIKNDPGSDFTEAFKAYQVPDISFISDEVILVQSLLKPSGSEYKELKVFKLK